MRVLFLTLGLSVALAAGAQDLNIAYVAKVTATPATEPGADQELRDGRTATALTFAVGTKGEGTVTFTFDHPRLISAVRFFQGSKIYRTTQYAIEGDATGQGEWKTLAEGADASVTEWVRCAFPPVSLRALRFRSVAGVSEGSRAHPCLGEIEILGKPEADDIVKASEMGIAVPFLPVVRPLQRETPLVVGGRGPALLAPEAPDYAAAVKALTEGLAAYKADPVATAEAADPAHRTVICLGNVNNNALLGRLYWNHYTFVDALVPGPGNYLLHTVYDPYPWTGGNNVIILGCSDAAGALPAVQAFLASLQDGKLPYLVKAGPQPLVTDADARAIAARTVNPTFEDFTNNVNAYLKTGCEAYAGLAVKALDATAALYKPGGSREKFAAHNAMVLPWNEETTSYDITCAWDAFEESPLLNDTQRLDASNAMLRFTRDLVGNVSDWGIKDPTVAWNHTTFPLLGVYGGARYFNRYYGIADMKQKLEFAASVFLAQAKGWKCQEDSDAYIPYVMTHTAMYCLGEGQTEFFSGGNYPHFADYVAAIVDNQGLGSGFGDSGVSSRSTEPLEVLPLALWWTKDPSYEWLMNQYTNNTWANPFPTGKQGTPPERFVGTRPFMMDPRVYEYTQTKPTYNEPFTKSDVPAEQAFDKVTFRDSWDPQAQYLVLDGLSRGKHLHFDGNSIIEFVEGGERWLLDHDYLTRNTTEHSMLSVLREGRGDQLVPSLAGLTAATDLPGFGYTDTYMKDYNGCDWQRQILWDRGQYFLVADTIAPRAAGQYDFEITWKTIDSAGEQRLVGGSDFVTERGGGSAKTTGIVIVDDPDASGGKAAIMEQAASRLAFGADLPAGEYSLDVIGYGANTSSDSVWISTDLGPNIAFNLRKGQYASSTADAPNTLPTPKVTLKGAGPHLVIVTLRENPPVHLDKFVFSDAAGKQTVYEAESLPQAPQPNASLSRFMHIKSATPATAFITNHERAGMSVPISLLHQRRGGAMSAGQPTRFVSLVYTSFPEKRRDLTPVSLGDHLVAIQGSHPALALLGPVQTRDLQAQTGAGLLTSDSLRLSRLTSLSIGPLKLAATTPADLQVDVKTGQAVAQAPAEGRLTVTISGKTQTVALKAGRQELTVAGLGKSAVGGAIAALIRAARSAKTSGATATAKPTAPGWTAFAEGSKVNCVKVMDLQDGLGPRVFACRGTSLHCLDLQGKPLWHVDTAGRLSDVAFGDLRPDKGLEIVIGSKDTHLYLLSAEGKVLEKRQMRGMPWARSIGDAAYGIFNVCVGDVNGDGKPEIAVTMANFDLQLLDADLKVIWKDDFALHGSVQLSMEDSRGTGQPDCVMIGTKYGSATGADATGKGIYSAYTSIGDVVYAVGDMDGDGKPEVVSGSSTGDLVATKFGYGLDPLWQFDNFGYPVNRLLCADLDGDQRAEVLLASGTGYVYAIKDGKLLWQDRVGCGVNDLLWDATRRQVVCADQGGLVRVLDATGKHVRDLPQPTAATLLRQTPTALLVALEDGRLMAYAWQ